MSDSEHPERPVYASPPGRPVRASWLLIGGIVSLLLILISFYYTGQWYAARSANRFLVAVAEDVAAAHVQTRPLEIESTDLGVVLAFFDTVEVQRVDMQRVREELVLRDAALLGALSLFIEGYPAIQLRYRDAGGRPVTRYVAVVPARQLVGLQGRVPGETLPRLLVDGVAISIWQARGLVFAEARMPT